MQDIYRFAECSKRGVPVVIFFVGYLPFESIKAFSCDFRLRRGSVTQFACPMQISPVKDNKSNNRSGADK